jgi:hypothetical protein
MCVCICVSTYVLFCMFVRVRVRARCSIVCAGGAGAAQVEGAAAEEAASGAGRRRRRRSAPGAGEDEGERDSSVCDRLRSATARMVRDVHQLMGDPAVVGQEGSAQARQSTAAVLDEVAMDCLEDCRQWLGGALFKGPACAITSILICSYLVVLFMSGVVSFMCCVVHACCCVNKVLCSHCCFV